MDTTIERLGRFGHHPNPAIDFCVEVEVLENEAFNHSIGFMNQTPSRDEIRKRIDAAMLFIVGGDIQAIAAKSTLRDIDESFTA